jgi:cobalamin biosynthesis Mg chelatase CobN
MKRIGSVAAKVLALVAMALLLSGCMKLNMALNVSSDNTVSGTMIFAVDKQLLQATGQSFDQLVGENPIASPGEAGVTTSPYEDNKFVGQKVTFDAVPLAQFAEDQGSDTLKIVREGDQFKVSGVLDLSSASSDTGDAQLDQILKEALKSADISIEMTFPGKVASSNGSVDGNSVTWNPKMGERTEINAVASAIPSKSSSSPWVWIVVGGVIVVAAIVAGVLMGARGKKGGEPALAAEGVEPAPADQGATPSEMTTESLPPAPPTPAPPPDETI